MFYQKLVAQLPHPVLSHTSEEHGDIEGYLRFELSDTEDNNSINLRLDLSCPWIKKLIQNRRVGLALMIGCLRTYFLDSVVISLAKDQIITVDETLLDGPVHFTLVAWVKDDTLEFTGAPLINDFEDLQCQVEKGDLIAISNELMIRFERPPIPLDNTVFQLNLSEDVTPNGFKIDLNNQHKLIILAGKNLHILHEQNCGSGERGHLLNVAAILMPALVAVLATLDTDHHSYEDKDWYQAIVS